MVAGLARSGADSSELGRIMDDCKDNLTAFSSFTFRHIYREANGVAHCLVHFINFSKINNLWLNETFSIIIEY